MRKKIIRLCYRFLAVVNGENPQLEAMKNFSIPTVKSLGWLSSTWISSIPDWGFYYEKTILSNSLTGACFVIGIEIGMLKNAGHQEGRGNNFLTLLASTMDDLHNNFDREQFSL